MVGDGGVGIAGVARGDDHRFERVAAVGCRRVDVDQAPHVGLLDEPRELSALRRLDLPPPLAQLRLDEGESQGGVEVRFAGGGDPLLGRPRSKEAVLVQLQTPSPGPAAKLRVVLLRAGEVEEGRGEVLRRDDAKVGGESVRETH